MNDSLSPYSPPNATAAPRRQHHASTWFVLPTIVVFTLNLALGAVNCRSDVCEFSKWGAYAGEYIVMVTWFAWGTGTLLNRFSTVSWMGILWMLASWVGFAVTKPDRVLTYSHEFSQILNVVPLAFLLSSLPLYCMRGKFGCEDQSDEKVESYSTPGSSVIMLAAVIVLLTIAYYTDDWLLSDVALSFTIAIVLGSVTCIASPLLSLALLGAQPKLSILLPTLVLLPVLGLFFAGFFGMPGPGAASTVYAGIESMLALSVALLPVGAAFCLWRNSGLRMRQGNNGI